MMLRHLACSSVDEQVKGEEGNIDAVVSVAKDKMSSEESSIISHGSTNCGTPGFLASHSQTGDSRVRRHCATASAGLFTTSSLNDIVSLPPMTRLCFTCRLFGNTSGKLLAHFEDSLDMYEDPASLLSTTKTSNTAIRQPIVFRIPTEQEVNDEEQEKKMKTNLTMPNGDSQPDLHLQYRSSSSLLQRHRNNSYFDAKGVQSSLSSDTGTATTRNSGAYYYGSVRDLSLGCSTTTTTTTAKRLQCCTKARIGQTSRHVLLEEPDKESGRTAIIGCVPIVPVARCRVATHKAASAAAAAARM